MWRIRKVAVLIDAMLSNHIYNLIMQLGEESKSLQRIQQCYESDAKDCTVCVSFWEKMRKDKENHIEELKKLVKDHL